MNETYLYKNVTFKSFKSGYMVWVMDYVILVWVFGSRLKMELQELWNFDGNLVFIDDVVDERVYLSFLRNILNPNVQKIWLFLNNCSNYTP